MASRAGGGRAFLGVRQSSASTNPSPAPPSIPQPAPLLPLPSRRLSSNFSFYFNRPPNLRSRKEPGSGGKGRRGQKEKRRRSRSSSRSPVCSLPPPSFLSPPPPTPPHPHILESSSAGDAHGPESSTGGNRARIRARTHWLHCSPYPSPDLLWGPGSRAAAPEPVRRCPPALPDSQGEVTYRVGMGSAPSSETEQGVRRAGAPGSTSSPQTNKQSSKRGEKRPTQAHTHRELVSAGQSKRGGRIPLIRAGQGGH